MLDLPTLLPIMLMMLAVMIVPKSAITLPAMRYILVVALAGVVGRYLWWRVTVTVVPATEWSIQSAFIWSLFVAEMLAWLDASLLFAAMLRKTNRTPEADHHEARLRAMEPGLLPIVDVFIATYNEPFEVLEKTIIGAVSLDWPRDRLRVWVLDDGKRDWLRDYCAGIGSLYMRRDNNAHAKAGNINAAIARTTGEFFAVFDADFIPQRNFLYRTMGFFEDPKIGIMQIPHNFFNHDPMQASLELRSTMPDDQRLFFDAIMPGRDGWDCAFCCGSNSVTRRSAINEVGGGLPTGSITEDMLLTLALLRKGYVTRYLNERLAVGLAPESLSAFFVQRARWARGAIQILYLREGPLGPGLRLPQRLMFLPTHWLTQSLSQIAAMTTPAIYLLTGLLPLKDANTATVFEYQVPAILGAILAVRIFAPGEYFPLAATAHAVLQAFRLLPTILVTLIKPTGHAFKVTPKGRDASDAGVDRPTALVALAIIVATSFGLMINSDLNLRVIGDGAIIPIVAFWAMVNVVVLSVVATIAVASSSPRGEERFRFDIPCDLETEVGKDTAILVDLSLTGAQLRSRTRAGVGDWLVLSLPGVGRIPVEVKRAFPAGEDWVLGVRLFLPQGPERRRVIQTLFTNGRDNTVHTTDAFGITLGILSRVFRSDHVPAALPEPEPMDPPSWVLAPARGTTVGDWREDAAADRTGAAA